MRGSSSRVVGALAVAAFLLVAGSATDGIGESAETCAERSVHASQIRTREDIRTFARCAQESVRDNGIDEAYPVFREDDQWNSGQFYVYVNGIARGGSGLRNIVYPPDPTREGLVWPPAVDRFGLDLRDERVNPALAAETGEGTWR